MARRSIKTKLTLATDPIYNSILVQLMINRIMKKGKRQLATNLLLHTFGIIQNQYKQDALHILQSAVKNLSPSVEIRSKRVGGAVYSVPIEIHSVRSNKLAIQLLLQSIDHRNGKNFCTKLANEMIEASKNMGTAIRRKEEIHRIAQLNAKLTKKINKKIKKKN